MFLNHLELTRLLLPAAAAVMGILAAGTAAQAELPPLIPRAALFGNPEKSGPQISPDGKMLAYLAPADGILNVWARTVGQSDDHVVTTDRKRPVRQFLWQGDSQHILYLQDQAGDENYHVYQTSLKTKTTRDMTPFPGARAEIISLNPKFPNAMLVSLNVRNPRLSDVYRVNLKNGALELDTESPDDVLSLVADNKMQIRAAQAALPDGGTEIRVRDTAKSAWRSLMKWGAEESLGGLAGFSPDNKKVWIETSLSANTVRLLQVDIASGKQSVLVEDSQYDVSGLITNPRTNKLEAVQINRDRSVWQALDKSMQADFDALQKARDGDFTITSRDWNDKIWTVAYTLSDAPVSFYTYDRATKQATLLFTARPALEKAALAKMQPVSWSARDGMKIHGYVTLPVGVEPKNLPTVLCIHGGPWARDNWGCNPMVQWLANRGYAVLQVNFRGSTGYGKVYLNAGDRQWAGAMHTDLLDGKQYMIQQGYADPSRIAIMGGSYGGYATLAALAFSPDAFTCGVDLFGPSNLNTLLASIPPYWKNFKMIFDKRMGEGETFLNSQSPLFKAAQIKVPLLIAQGANDVRVKQAESDQIVAAMRKNNQPVEYLVFPDEGHGFARPENNLAFTAQAEAFLAKYLGGRVEPIGESEKADAFRK